MMHEKTKLLNLTSDVIFKNFFMNENTIEYTAEFINLITGIPKEEIMKKAVFENIELPIINKNSKRYKCLNVCYSVSVRFYGFNRVCC